MSQNSIICDTEKVRNSLISRGVTKPSTNDVVSQCKGVSSLRDRVKEVVAYFLDNDVDTQEEFSVINALDEKALEEYIDGVLIKEGYSIGDN